MKVKFGITFLLFGLVVLTSGTAPKVYYKSGTFKVGKAESSTIFPGVQGAYIVNRYTMNLTMKKSREIVFDSAWVDGQAVKCYVLSVDNSTDVKYDKGNTFILHLESYQSTGEIIPLPEGVVRDEPKMQNPPVKHNGKLLFKYKILDQVYYYSVKNFKATQNVYAP